MKTLKLIFVLIIIGLSVKAQKNDNELPVNRHKEGHTLSYFIGKPDNLKRFSFSIGYNQTNFLNPAYYENTRNSNIKLSSWNSKNISEMPLIIRFEGILYPLLFNIEWFSRTYSINSYVWPYTGETDIRHKGANFFISTTFPTLLKSPFIIPYMGIGYQVSKLAADDAYLSGPGKNYSFINTSSPLWKVGIEFRALQKVMFAFEWKQSLNLKSDKSFNQMAILLGLNF